MVVPCPGVQPIQEALEDCSRNIIPIILYALSQDALTPEQIDDLHKVREALHYPICFIRMPSSSPSSSSSSSPCLTPEASPESSRAGNRERNRERSALYTHLLSLGFLSGGGGGSGGGSGTLENSLSSSTPAPVPGSAPMPQSLLGESFERLHRLLGTFAKLVVQNQQVEAANRLNGVHCRCLDLFINQVRWRLNIASGL